MPVVEHVTLVAAPLARVFDCARALDLPPVIALASGGEPGRRVAGPDRPLLEKGDERTWTRGAFRRSIVLRTAGCDAGRWLREQRVRGPFHIYHHDRYFEAVAGGTRVHDMLAFRVGMGPLGRVLERLFVYRRMREALARQCEVLRAAAEGAAAAEAKTG